MYLLGSKGPPTRNPRGESLMPDATARVGTRGHYATTDIIIAQKLSGEVICVACGFERWKSFLRQRRLTEVMPLSHNE